MKSDSIMPWKVRAKNLLTLTGSLKRSQIFQYGRSYSTVHRGLHTNEWYGESYERCVCVFVCVSFEMLLQGNQRMGFMHNVSNLFLYGY